MIQYLKHQVGFEEIDRYIVSIMKNRQQLFKLFLQSSNSSPLMVFNQSCKLVDSLTKLGNVVEKFSNADDQVIKSKLKIFYHGVLTNRMLYANQLQLEQTRKQSKNYYWHNTQMI